MNNGRVIEVKIKRRTERGGIKGTFNYAMRKAAEQGWTKMVIVGEGKGTGKTVRSRMTDNTAIALINKALHVTLRDSCDGDA
jgi:hypothetical protein